MNLAGVDLNLLIVFEAVLAEGSMTKAAERLDMGQPTLSNALNRLRKSLDDPLFVRSAKGMQPTPKALLLAEPIAEALSLLRESFQSSIEFDAENHKQHFRIGMSDYTASRFLPPLITWLREHAKGITVSVPPLQRNAAHEALQTGKLDLLITNDFSGPGIYQQRLYDESFKCLMSRKHFSEKELGLDDYLAKDHLLYSLDGVGPGPVDRALTQLGKKRNVTVRVAYVGLIPDIIEKTDLIVTLPAGVADQFSRRDDIVVFDAPVELPMFSVKQFWHEKFHRDPGLKWFREQVLMIAGNLAGND